jgi:hypothetical protein
LDRYDLVFPQELQIMKPTHIFKNPLVFEIMGGGFDKQTNCAFFTPRHPRVSKIHDRDFTEVVSFDELQLLAEDAIRGEHIGSQEERQWIARLQRGDIGQQLEETPQKSAGSEDTPVGLRMVTPPKKRRKINDFDSTQCSTASHITYSSSGESGLRTPQYSPQTKRPRLEPETMKPPGSCLSALMSCARSKKQQSSPTKRRPLAQISLAINSLPSRLSSPLSPLATLESTVSTADSMKPKPSLSPELTDVPLRTTSSPQEAISLQREVPLCEKDTPVLKPVLTYPIRTATATLRYGPRWYAEEISPFSNARVYIIPHLMKYSGICERLLAHGIEMFEEFSIDSAIPSNPKTNGGQRTIILVDAWKAEIIQDAIRALTERRKKESLPEHLVWEVWNWKVVKLPTPQEMVERKGGKILWTCDKYWDI